MTRLLLPRVYAATALPDPETSQPEPVAVLALDTTEDEYLVIGASGYSWWAPMAEVRFCDELVRSVVNRADELVRADQRERQRATGAAA